MKVRIGNDICLHVTLLGNQGIDYINIKSIRAFLINTSKQQDLDAQRRYDSVHYHDEMEDRRRVVKYVGRFPAEPHCRPYHGTPYDLLHCGHPTFHVHPVWAVAPYVGFGVYPHTFDPFHNHLWGYDDMMDLHDKMLMKDEDYKEQYGRCEFMAPVMATDQPNVVDVHFPAENQIYKGNYKLMLIVKLYEPGYGRNNLRTVTMDYQDILTLVGSSDEEGASGNIMISVGNSNMPTGINVYGTFIVPQRGGGTLTAEVLPRGLDDDSITWSVPAEYNQYINIDTVHDKGKFMSYITNALPEGVEYMDVTIIATANKGNAVSKPVNIHIVADASSIGSTTDKYVTGGQYVLNPNQDGIVLNVNGGDDVFIDTGWYEPEGQ